MSIPTTTPSWAPAGLNARFRAGYEAHAPLDRAGGHLAAARRFARGTRPGAAERAVRAAARATAELDA